jgi:hypothetical protein
MRNKKISADISKEASDQLNNLVAKHDRSKGWLLDKMIKKFYSEEEKPTTASIATVEKPVKKFTQPTPLEVDGYFVERGVNDPNEAQSFCDFYESNGWKVGKNKMKCWKASVRNWLKGYKEKSGGNDILQKSSDSDWHKQDQGF